MGLTDSESGRINAIFIRKKIEKPSIFINGLGILTPVKIGFSKLKLFIRVDGKRLAGKAF